MTNNLYEGKIVLVPCIVCNNIMRFKGQPDEVKVDVIKNLDWYSSLTIPKTLVIEPTEEQLIEIERYAN